VARRILFVSHGCYLDDANGAAVASRALMQAMARRGFAVEALSGTMLDLDQEVDPAGWLAGCGIAFGTSVSEETSPIPPHFRLEFRGVPITLHRSPTTRLHDADDAEREGFLFLLGMVLNRFGPDVIVCYGGNRLADDVRTAARALGLAVVFPLHNFHYRDPSAFALADAILVPSHFAADYYREALGLDCTVLPNAIDVDRAQADRVEPRYVTFVNPSIEKGVYAFARIADELGKRRPDIPLLVVEGRGTEATVASCGLDLRVHGNVHFMAHTSDPRRFWRVTKLCLLPSLWWETQSLVAVEAMLNGIPVIGSDRGAIPETLGQAGLILPLPDRLTPATPTLPTPEEVAPWVEAVIRLWDNAAAWTDRNRLALVESARWLPEVVEPAYCRFFEEIRPGSGPPLAKPPRRHEAVVLVPYHATIDEDCDRGLRGLETEGVRVVRRGGCSAIDVARNCLASEALHDGAESILFIDSDIGFDPRDALRLFARPEPVVAGIYAKKGHRSLASTFAADIDEVIFGAGARGLYPLLFASTGFLCIHASVLRRMIAELTLPACNTRWGRAVWPFFLPMIVPDGDGHHYLGEDWAFSDRLRQIGVTPMADTTIRLWHFGRHGFGWEDAGEEANRSADYAYQVKRVGIL